MVPLVHSESQMGLSGLSGEPISEPLPFVQPGRAPQVLRNVNGGHDLVALLPAEPKPRELMSARVWGRS
jgi:hypothetical protein